MRERFAAGILVLTILLIGLWPYPFVEVIKHGVDPILSGILGGYMTNNFSLLIPEFLVTGLAFLILSLDLFISEKEKII